MRLGLVLSSLLHLSLIGFGLFTLKGQNLDHQALDVESIAIDLVPISDEMSVREGATQAPASAVPAPKPTQKPEINQAARHVGDGQVDSAAPLNERQRVREVEAPPPPPPPPPTNTQPPQEAKPTEPAEPVTPVAPVAPQQAATPPVEEPAPAEAAPVEAAPPDEPREAAAIIPPLPQQVPAPKQKPRAQTQPTAVAATAAPPQTTQTSAQAPAQTPTQPQQTIDELVEKSAALIDRTPTQGGGMRRAAEPAGAGASRTIGDNQQLAQTIQNVIGSCIKRNARITVLTGSLSSNLIVKVHMRLNRDGSIDGVPDLTPSGGEASEREIAVTQGYAALARCSPFVGLPPERYDDGWNEVILNWRPLD